MQKKIDVVALGELLIDFTENENSPQGNPLFEANPGGAPCNVLAMLAKLNHSVQFIGKVGKDGFGELLTNALKEQGIGTEGLCYDDKVHTTLAFVVKKEDGDRDFVFYRNPGADINLKEEEIDEALFANTKIFHLGSLSLTSEPAIRATKKALTLAKKYNVLISFDPNLRKPLWDSLEKAHDAIDFVMKQADILKISDDEIIWFTKTENYEDALSFLREKYPNLKLIALTLGKEGSRVLYKNIDVYHKAYLHDAPLETTGCGDTFCGYMLHTVLDKGLENLEEETLKEMLQKANAASSLVSRKKGALRVMPTEEEIENLVKE